jgi:hypothetical protein
MGGAVDSDTSVKELDSLMERVTDKCLLDEARNLMEQDGSHQLGVEGEKSCDKAVPEESVNAK